MRLLDRFLKLVIPRCWGVLKGFSMDELQYYCEVMQQLHEQETLETENESN